MDLQKKKHPAGHKGYITDRECTIRGNEWNRNGLDAADALREEESDDYTGETVSDPILMCNMFMYVATVGLRSGWETSHCDSLSATIRAHTHTYIQKQSQHRITESVLSIRDGKQQRGCSQWFERQMA